MKCYSRTSHKIATTYTGVSGWFPRLAGSKQTTGTRRT